MHSSAQSEAPGYQPHQPYDAGSLVDVNLYNLNIILKLPLAQSYPVNERLSYGLTAYYNGALQWESDPNGSYYGASIGNPALHGWLGAGWRLDFGKVMNVTVPDPPSPDCIAIASTWISPGGGRHPFSSSNLGTTTDGSDLRIGEVAFPWSPSCPVPTRADDRVNSWELSSDPNTGRVTRIEMAFGGSTDLVDISYMEPADFLLIDPGADPNSWNYDSPWDWEEERTFAIKEISDTHGRIIRTSMENIALDPNRTKFLLREIHVPVFGDSPGVPTGVYTLHYETRTITTQPPGWPPLVPGIASIPWPYLVRVELPADAAGNRLTYVFDYNAYGELAEIRTPRGGLTKIIWGNEYINADEPGVVESTPVRRVVAERQEYPDPYGSPTLFYSWKYAHSPYPPSMGLGGSGPIYDSWRTIVTDPGGNDSEYRFYTTEQLSFDQRNFFYPRGLVGAVKYYRGQTKRWRPDAQSMADLDPNFPGGGALVRGVYSRHLPVDPNMGFLGPVLLEGVQTVYYDDRLTPTPTPLDPTSDDSGLVAIYEMEFDLTPQTGPPRQPAVEGFATHIVLHDPARWQAGYYVGTKDDTAIHVGNLVGGREIRFEGGDAPCDIYGDFGAERTVYVDGNVAEYSQAGQPCVRRHDVSRSYDFDDRDRVYSRDVGVGWTWNNGFVTDLTYTGGDPDSVDANATGNSGITYHEVRTHQAGVLKTRKYDGVSWFSLDRDIDVATALPSVSRNPAAVPTSFAYDALGRRTLTAPPAPEFPTSVAYLVETALGGLHKFTRSTESRTGPPGDPGELYSRQDRDGFGRVIRETRLRDDGGTLVRDYTYDGLGAVTFRSEWHDPNSPSPHPGASYDYNIWNFAFPPVGTRDPFSRPWKITDAAGAVVKVAHFGLNESRWVTHINQEPTTPGPGLTATTHIYRDYRGNVRIVDAAEGSDALYDYDASGRLTNVTLVGQYTWKEYDPADPNVEGLRDNRFAAFPTPGTQVQTRSRAHASTTPSAASASRRTRSREQRPTLPTIPWIRSRSSRNNRRLLRSGGGLNGMPMIRREGSWRFERQAVQELDSPIREPFA